MTTSYPLRLTRLAGVFTGVVVAPLAVLRGCCFVWVSSRPPSLPSFSLALRVALMVLRSILGLRQRFNCFICLSSQWTLHSSVEKLVLAVFGNQRCTPLMGHDGYTTHWPIQHAGSNHDLSRYGFATFSRSLANSSFKLRETLRAINMHECKSHVRLLCLPSPEESSLSISILVIIPANCA